MIMCQYVDPAVPSEVPLLRTNLLQPLCTADSDVLVAVFGWFGPVYGFVVLGSAFSGLGLCVVAELDDCFVESVLCLCTYKKTTSNTARIPTADPHINNLCPWLLVSFISRISPSLSLAV